MNVRQSLLGFSALLMLCAGPAFAATNVEIDAENNLTFSPATQTINVGDSVTFKNKGGNHNVVADDNSFTNGPANTTAWSYTRTFNTAGTFRFYCVNHGAPGGIGMSGVITVNSVAATGPNISGGFSGNWFNPTAGQGGHGFQIEVLPNNGMLAIWFVFDPTGTQQNWIFSQGPYDPTSNTVTLPAFLEQGGRFPPNFTSSTITAPAWGSITFTFTDCNNGTAKWTSNATSAQAGYGDVSFPIQRLSTIAGTTCP